MNTAFDGWTFLHLASGAALGLLKVSRLTAYSLIVATEILEFILHKMFPESNLFQETGVNILSDVVTSALAYEIVR